MRIPGWLDRYPAKMVGHLAEGLMERYANDAQQVFDPFCGSGVIVASATRRGIAATGIDVNPLAELFSRVKVRGITQETVEYIASDLIERAKSTKSPWEMTWPSKKYWFTDGTLEKLERLRASAADMNLYQSETGRSVLLSLVLTVRLCSRADQRSPKPFISQCAREQRRGRHYDPYSILLKVLRGLTNLHKMRQNSTTFRFWVGDVVRDTWIPQKVGLCSHVITSPPYINAQDYFRNFKLELHVLEGLLPFRVDDLRERFIGTERGHLLAGIPHDAIQKNYKLVPGLKKLEQKTPRSGAVVHRYFYDMANAFNTIRSCLKINGNCIIVCGDNRVGGHRIRTWEVLKQLLEERGFELFDCFIDPIMDRLLPPKRCGHKGLIKEEVVCAYKLRG